MPRLTRRHFVSFVSACRRAQRSNRYIIHNVYIGHTLYFVLTIYIMCKVFGAEIEQRNHAGRRFATSAVHPKRLGVSISI